MHNTAAMPNLANDAATDLVHGIGDRLPGLDLMIVLDTGRIRPA
jgi:hypothetical protein